MRRYGSKGADSGATAASAAAASSIRARVSSTSSAADVLYAIDGLAAADGCLAVESAAIALVEVLVRQKGTRSLSRQGIGQAFVGIIGVALGLRTQQNTGSIARSTTAPGADGSFRLHWTHNATSTDRATHLPAPLTAATVFALLLSLYLLSSSSCGTLVDVMAPDCVLLCVEGLCRCSAAQASVLRAEEDGAPLSSVSSSHPLRRFSSNQSSAARLAAAAGSGVAQALRSPPRMQTTAAAEEASLRKGVRSYGSIAPAPLHSHSSSGSARTGAPAPSAPAVKRRRVTEPAESSAGDAWAFEDDDDGDSGTAASAVRAGGPVAGRADGYVSSASSVRSSASLASSAARKADSAASRSGAAAEELPSQLARVLASVLGRGWCPWLSYADDAGAEHTASEAAAAAGLAGLVPPRGRYAALLSAGSSACREPRDLYRVLLGRLSLFLLHRMVAADLDDAVDVGGDAGRGAGADAPAAGTSGGAGAGAASAEDSPAAASAGADTDVSAAAVAARISGTRRALLQAYLPAPPPAPGAQADATVPLSEPATKVAIPAIRALSVLAQGLHREWEEFRATSGAAADTTAPVAVACWLAICEDVSLIAAAASSAANARSHSVGAGASAAHGRSAADGSLLEVFLHGEAPASSSAASAAAAPAAADVSTGVGDVMMSILAWAEQPAQLARLHLEPLCKVVQGCLTVLVNCTNNVTAGVQALMRWRDGSNGGSSSVGTAAAVDSLPMALTVVARILQSSLAASLPSELRKAEAARGGSAAAAGAEAAFNTAVLCLGLLTNCAEHSDAVRVGCFAAASSAPGGSAATLSAIALSLSSSARPQSGGFLLDAVCRAFAQHHAVVAASLDTADSLSSGRHHSGSGSGTAAGYGSAEAGSGDGYETEAVEDAANGHGDASAGAPTGHASDSVVLAAYSALFLTVLLGEADTACGPAEASALLQRVGDALRQVSRSTSVSTVAAGVRAGAAAIEALQLSLRVFARLQGDAGLLTPDVAAHLAAAEAAVLRLRDH